jgi:hypothetical protein
MFGYKANIINIAYEGILFSKPPRNSTGTSNRSQQCIARHTKMRSLHARYLRVVKSYEPIGSCYAFT